MIGSKPPIGAMADLTHPYGRGLIGAWLLGDGAGSQAHDHSVYRNRVALTNLDFMTAWTGSPGGNALEFDGVDDFGLVGPNQNVIALTGITVSVWVFSTTAQTNKGILGSWTTPSRAWLFNRTANANEISFTILTADQSQPNAVQGGIDITAGWTHLVGTWGPQTGNQVTLIVNGGEIVKTGDLHAGPLDPDGQEIEFGRRSASAALSYAGQIRDVLLYDRGMTIAEAKGLYSLSLDQLFK